MSRVAWHFVNPFTSEEIDLSINPDSGDSPQLGKTLNYVSLSAPGNGTIIQEGRDKPQTMSFSGTTLTEDQYNTWVSLFNIRNQLEFTDDLGRTCEIYITDFQPKRVRSVSHPWQHTITVNFTIIT